MAATHQDCFNPTWPSAMRIAQMLDPRLLCEASGLREGDLILGVTRTPKHSILLTFYLLNLWRGEDAVLDMIVADFEAALDMGARDDAGDILMTLRLFLRDFPEARRRCFARIRRCDG
jgi:hypothetical protein